MEFRAKALLAMADFASKVTVLVLDRMKRTPPYFVVTIQSWVKRVLWGSSGQACHSSRFRKANQCGAGVTRPRNGPGAPEIIMRDRSM
ncbi:MAG: hypothetical protein ABSH06_29930 [Thermodesulfobacteriota bacterium]